MRDTEGNPRGGWSFSVSANVSVAGGQVRVVETLGDELGELLHPRGEDSRDDAPRVHLVVEDESREGG